VDGGAKETNADLNKVGGAGADYYMSLALVEAQKAFNKGEIPIGAVIVCGGKIIARAHNLREKKQNALYHAEVLAINRACKRLKSWRLDTCDLYVTLQPCQMCAGAITNARIRAVYFGETSTSDLNWTTPATYLKNAACGQILKDFFKGARGG
jgi:tRNA(Arg) A34 adenosine deaminase TadA